MKKHQQKEVGFQAKEKNQERNKKQVASDKKKKRRKNCPWKGGGSATNTSVYASFSWVWVKSALISLSKTRGHWE